MSEHKINLEELWDRNEDTITSRLNASDPRIAELRNRYTQTDHNNTLPVDIGIETISRCNSKCSFCPVSVQNEKRPLKRMSEETWRLIIDQLEGLSFSGNISPYINNEIFLDKDIFSRLEYARSKLSPDVFINIETNGLLLKEEKDRGLKLVEKMFKYVDQILINDYADTEENYLNFNPRIRYLIANLPKIKTERKAVLKPVHRRLNQLLNNRFGKVEGSVEQKVPENELFCDFPFFQMNFNPDGGAFICCRDSYYEETIGNIHKNTIKEIWQGDRYKEIRDGFIANERIAKVCKKCTSSGTLTI